MAVSCRRVFAADYSLAVGRFPPPNAVAGQLVLTRFQDTYTNHKPVPEELLELLKVMAS